METYKKKLMIVVGAIKVVFSLEELLQSLRWRTKGEKKRKRRNIEKINKLILHMTNDDWCVINTYFLTIGNDQIEGIYATLKMILRDNRNS